jgi:hypothetical protein
MGHFYIACPDKEFECTVVKNLGDICGQRYKKSGGGRARTKHIINQHSDLYDAVKEFRKYQCMIRGIDVPVEQDDDETFVPPTPKRLRSFEEARDEFIVGNMKQPLPYETTLFDNHLMKLVAIHGASFGLIESDTFKAMCGLLNPLYRVPSTETLQRRMEERVTEMRLQIKHYIHKHVCKGSLTADCWTSTDQRKFFGVTFHFMTPQFEMASALAWNEFALLRRR